MFYPAISVATLAQSQIQPVARAFFAFCCTMSEPEPPIAAERRQARDEKLYNFEQFRTWYGGFAQEAWNQASCERRRAADNKWYTFDEYFASLTGSAITTDAIVDAWEGLRAESNICHCCQTLIDVEDFEGENPRVCEICWGYHHRGCMISTHQTCCVHRACRLTDHYGTLA